MISSSKLHTTHCLLAADTHEKPAVHFSCMVNVAWQQQRHRAVTWENLVQRGIETFWGAHD